MSPFDDRQRDSPPASDGDAAKDARIAALEEQVAALRADVASLHTLVGRTAEPAQRLEEVRRGPPQLSPELAHALQRPPRAPGAPGSAPARSSLADWMHAAAIGGAELESLVGRYATLALAALVILMAVGAVIKMAVDRGLLTPPVRVAAGAIAAILVAIAGAFFRRRGDVRYGNVLLAISLAIVDLVAWGAGPRLHLVPTSTALVLVDVVAIALAWLALHDGSEFLFAVSVSGALSSPFVTSDGSGTALGLLLYGGAVLAGGLRSTRDARWMRAFALLVIGALVYAVAAAALPMSDAWYGPFLVTLFCSACAVAALLFGEEGWQGELPRAYLAVALVGVTSAWDAIAQRPLMTTMGVCVAVAMTTYAALHVRGSVARYWTPSALLLPLLSLAVAYAGVGGSRTEAAVFGTWAVFAFIAWRMEHRAGEWSQAGTHLLAASVLGAFAVTVWLWSEPLPLVAGLAAWGVFQAWLGKDEQSVLPVAGIALATGASALSAVDQLASRSAYSYVPFATRSSASALAALVGLGLAGALIGRGEGKMRNIADRPVQLAVPIGFAILWGRMELANAYNSDLAVFLPTAAHAPTRSSTEPISATTTIALSAA